jgi:N-acetylneuraminic acid mutarotase
MPTIRGGLGLASASNGRIYAIGGYRRSGIFFDVVEEYDPATDTWTTRANMPTPRDKMGVVTASNGKIYAIGGYDWSQLDTVEEYDPAADTWTTRASMPTARAGVAAAAASNGKIYVFGGISGSRYVTTVEEYDPAMDTWTTRASMPTARNFAGAAEASNGKIYVIGGKDRLSGTFPAVGTVEEYDPATDTWATRASISLPRYELGVVAASNGRVYAIGGRDYVRFGGYTFHAEYQRVEEYDPATDTWLERADMPTARAALGAAQASNGRIYAVGGSDYGLSTDIYYDVVEEYTPPSIVPHSLYLPTVLRGQ